MALVATCVLVGCVVWIVTRSGGERDAAPGPTTVAPPPRAAPAPTGFPIDTAAFRFVLPSEPQVDPVEAEVQGIALAGTAWQVERDGQLIQVLAIEWPEPLDDAAAQASFDASNGGMARRSGGVDVSDESLVVDGVTQRISRIEIEGGNIHVHAFAVGSWTVSIAGSSDGADPLPPDEFDAVVASLEFTI
jgi:hypothetical protein